MTEAEIALTLTGTAELVSHTLPRLSLAWDIFFMLHGR